MGEPEQVLPQPDISQRQAYRLRGIILLGLPVYSCFLNFKVLLVECAMTLPFGWQSFLCRYKQATDTLDSGPTRALVGDKTNNVLRMQKRSSEKTKDDFC